MSADSAGLPEELRKKRQLSEGERLRFSCHSGLPCFNRCCADVNIFLTPVDVLQLSRRLGLSTGEFLDKHTLTPITKDLQLPVVILRMEEAPDKPCPFVGDDGCTVYENRPWSCRMYPLAPALPPARAGVEPKIVYFLLEDEFCKGREEGREWTVEEWQADQGIRDREDLESGFHEIVSHPWFIGGRKLDAKRIELFHLACYDLDTFRRFVFDSTFLERFELESELIEQLKTDDEALLRFAYRWLRFALFAEPTMTVRKDAEMSARSNS